MQGVTGIKKNNSDEGAKRGCSIFINLLEVKYYSDNVPFYVILGHELIHALHYANGEEKRGWEEDYRTIGIGEYGNEFFSENAIRREHGFVIRKEY